MKTKPDMLQIAGIVCEHFKISYLGHGGIKSSKKSPKTVLARAVIVHIGKRYDYSYPMIAPFAGYRGHSGAIEAHQKIKSGYYKGWKNKTAKIIKELDSN